MRLIDADKSPACKDCIIRAYCDYTEQFGGECIVELILKNQPTAVGQCDECKHAGYYPDYELIYCSEISCVMPFDGFCHRFEKIEVDK